MAYFLAISNILSVVNFLREEKLESPLIILAIHLMPVTVILTTKHMKEEF